MDVSKIMKLADEYADRRGAEDCGADPKCTDEARAELEDCLSRMGTAVAKLKPCQEGWFVDLDNPPPLSGETITLYTHPAATKPLSQEQIENVCVEVHLKRDFNTNLEKFVAIARAVEEAHRIKIVAA